MAAIYYNVPFSQKDKIKSMGGKWNPIYKKWYLSDKYESVIKEADDYWVRYDEATVSSFDKRTVGSNPSPVEKRPAVATKSAVANSW